MLDARLNQSSSKRFTASKHTWLLSFPPHIPHYHNPNTHSPAPSKTTTHFLSAPEFALLSTSNPRGTYIANISRGGIIDQPALITALESGQISGAALDVTDPEPLPADDPLWSAPNEIGRAHV